MLQTQSFIAASNRRMHWMIAVQVGWLAFLFLLVGWWVRVVLKQADRIAELEHALGANAVAAQEQWAKTYRMLSWEAGTFFGLLAVSSGLLLWMHWRDIMRNRSLQAFFASITHELRTPLTSVRLQAESIAELLEGKAEEKELVQRLLEDTQRLEAQVERTLELARVEGGGSARIEPVQLRQAVGRLVQSWTQGYGDKATVRTAIDDVTVEADPAALSMIVKNLLENGMRHSRKERVEMELSTVVRDRVVELRYRDNGEGFKGSERKLGTVFYRGPGSHGSGIGLYLISVLMKQMGGQARFGKEADAAASGFAVNLLFKGRQDG